MVHFKLVLKGIGLFLWLIAIDFIIQTIWAFGALPGTTVFGGILTVICMAIASYLLIKPIYKKLASKDDRFKITKYTKEDWLFAIKWITILFVINIVINVFQNLLLKHVVVANNQHELESMSKLPGMLPGLIFVALFVGPVLEELIFRGVLTKYFTFKLKPVYQILISGLLFGAFHVIGGSFQITALIEYSTMGLVFGYVYWKTQRLQMSMLIHFINNLVATVLLLITILF